MRLRAAAAFLSYAVVLTLSGGASLQAQTPVWSGPAPHGPLQPFVLDMMGTLKKDDGSMDPPVTFHDTLEKIDWHGHKAMRRIAATTPPGGTEFVRWSTIVFDEKTLLPYYTEWRKADGAFVRREFDGVRVKERRTAADFRAALPPEKKEETVTSNFDLAEPAFGWIEGVGLPVLLAVPLREGFEGSVPVISGSASAVVPCFTGPCYVIRMSYRVVGQEEFTGLSGKPTKTWRVAVPESRFTFWISCDKPRLEGVTWPGPATGGTYSMGPITKR